VDTDHNDNAFVVEARTWQQMNVQYRHESQEEQEGKRAKQQRARPAHGVGSAGGRMGNQMACRRAADFQWRAGKQQALQHQSHQ